jgi:threonine dehydrogenase-like Zn-dependent dehydrogenase
VGDRRGERLDVVRRMGASAAVHASEAGSLPGLVADALDGGSCDVVFECTGSAEGLEAALGSVRRGGRIVLVGFHRVPRELALLPLTLDEVELVGTNSLSVARDLERGLQLLGARPDGWHDVAPAAIPLEGLVDDALLPLAEGRQRHIKVLVDPVARAPRATSN